ncbi:MAG: hemolysin [Acidimicrobiia bacterium]|nr:hemolysin [Acidimicrobiia bacterium]
MVRRGLVTSRTEAQDLIAAGRVLVAGASADKSSRMVAPAEPLTLLGPPARYVGRGGLKLEGALDHFAIDVEGLRVLDAGASTGGFSDCALQRGAREIVAVDVGHGQLHPKLRDDPRVQVLERVNVRHLTPADIGGPVDAVVADLSFISLVTVAPALLACVRPGGPLVLLVKPQFEAGRADVSRGRGVIRDPEVWARVQERVSGAYAERGAAIMGWMTSPIHGADGNVEFLLHAIAGEPR